MRPEIFSTNNEGGVLKYTGPFLEKNSAVQPQNPAGGVTITHTFQPKPVGGLIEIGCLKEQKGETIGNSGIIGS